MVLKERIIKERVKELKEVIENLKEISQLSQDEFVSSYKHYWLAERGLQLAAEILFDIGNHILAGYYKISAKDYEDILDKLKEVKVISPNLRNRLLGLGGFRNILVHEYLIIDRNKIYDELKTGLIDFENFIKEIISWLKKVK